MEIRSLGDKSPFHYGETIFLIFVRQKINNQ